MVALTGARQTGKTTLAQSLPGRRSYLSLDDIGVLGQARSDPESLLATRPVILDEVQRAPELLLPVKREVDRRRRAGDFRLTGSAKLLLMGSVADSLAGRAVYLELPPFCPIEWLERAGCLIARIAPYASSPVTGLVNSKKLYWNDCGLAAWLANVRSRQDLRPRHDQGFWLEQTLYQSLQSWRSLDGASRRIWYWRDRSGREVDFVLEKDGALVALEIKASQ